MIKLKNGKPDPTHTNQYVGRKTYCMFFFEHILKLDIYWSSLRGFAPCHALEPLALLGLPRDRRSLFFGQGRRATLAFGPSFRGEVGRRDRMV